MKAIIITYYNAPNYGAFLQAYAMQSFLEKNGHTAHIKYHKATDSSLFTRLLDIKTDKDTISYRKKLHDAVRCDSRRLNVSKDKSAYDLAILGSDEIWNIKNLTAKHYRLFFQPFKGAKKTISYAACSGNCTAKHLKFLPYCKNIKKLNAISVRDDKTEKTIKDFIGIDAERVLDPTFLYDFSEEAALPKEMPPYMLVYTYGMSTDTIEVLKEYCKKNGLSLVATGSLCDWADTNLLPTPFEWLGLIKSSAILVTTTFHGSVFGIKFRKNFITVNDHSAKIDSLLKEFNLTDRMVSAESPEKLKELLNTTVTYSKTEELIKNKIQKSRQFILEQL